MDKSKLDFISLAIQGKKVGFEKVIQIDEMVVTLKKEQADDRESRSGRKSVS